MHLFTIKTPLFRRHLWKIYPSPQNLMKIWLIFSIFSLTSLHFTSHDTFQTHYPQIFSFALLSSSTLDNTLFFIFHLINCKKTLPLILNSLFSFKNTRMPCLTTQPHTAPLPQEIRQRLHHSFRITTLILQIFFFHFLLFMLFDWKKTLPIPPFLPNHQNKILKSQSAHSYLSILISFLCHKIRNNFATSHRKLITFLCTCNHSRSFLL